MENFPLSPKEMAEDVDGAGSEEFPDIAIQTR
jgi:hypothetical protein